MVGVGQVTGGVDARVGGAQRRVGHHPIVDLQAGVGGQAGVGHGADAHHHDVRGQRRARRGDHLADLPGRAPDLAHRLAEPELHAVLAVQVGEHLAQLGADRAVQRGRLRLDHRHLAAGLAGRRRRLQADPARAHGDHPPAAAEGGREPLRVADGPQVQHAVPVGPGYVQPAWRRAGGQQQPVVSDALPVRGGDRPAGRIHRGDRHAEPQVHVVPGVPALLVHVDHGLVFLAKQVALGQRGPLIGPLGLGAEHDDPAAEPLRAEGLGRLRAGQARADDHEGGLSGHRIVLPWSLRPAPGTGGGARRWRKYP